MVLQAQVAANEAASEILSSLMPAASEIGDPSVDPGVLAEYEGRWLDPAQTFVAVTAFSLLCLKQGLPANFNLSHYSDGEAVRADVAKKALEVSHREPEVLETIRAICTSKGYRCRSRGQFTLLIRV